MARDFDGSADYLTELISPISAYPCTLSCWVKPDAVSGGSNKYLLSFGDTGSSTNYAAIFINQSTATLNLVHSSSGAAQVSSGPSISAGVWSHAAGLWSSLNSRTSYLNGTAGTTNTVTKVWPPINNVAIGALRRSTLGAYTDGAIAEAAIYNVALSADEISVLAAGLSPLLVRPESLVAYWPLFGRGGASSDEEDWAYAGALSQVSSPGVADHPRIIYPRRRAAIMVPQAAAAAPTLSNLQASSITSSSVQGTYNYAF